MLNCFFPMHWITTVLVCSLPIEFGYSQEKEISTSHITDEACFVLRCDVQKLLCIQQMGSEAVEGLTKQIEEQAAVKLINITAITVQNCKAAREDAWFYQSGVAMTVELTKEVDKEKPLPKALGDNRPMEEVIMGKKS